MHVIGAVLGIMQLVWTIFFSLTIGNIIMIPLIVFGFGLIGHLYFEKNYPIADEPWLGLQCDLIMVK